MSVDDMQKFKQIEELQNKITEQQKEILKLQEQIRLLSLEKIYDC